MKLLLSIIAVLVCSFVISYSYAADDEGCPAGDPNCAMVTTPSEAVATNLGADTSCPTGECHKFRIAKSSLVVKGLEGETRCRAALNLSPEEVEKCVADTKQNKLPSEEKKSQ